MAKTLLWDETHLEARGWDIEKAKIYIKVHSTGKRKDNGQPGNIYDAQLVVRAEEFLKDTVAPWRKK